MSFVGVTYAEVTGSSGTTVDVTRSVTAGNYLVAVGAAFATTDFSLAFNTQTGTTSAWTEIAAADAYDAGDDYTQEAAWATATNTESITVRLTVGTATTDRFVALLEFTNVTGFDVALYGRDTAATWETAGLSNTNANATRAVFGAWWGGGTGAADTAGGYTDNGVGWNFGGNFARVQSRVETSVTSRTGGFAAGTGVSPAHITQFIFNEVTAGGTVNVVEPGKLAKRRTTGRILRGIMPILHVGAATPPVTGPDYGVPMALPQRNRRKSGRFL